MIAGYFILTWRCHVFESWNYLMSYNIRLAAHGAMSYGQKNFKLLWLPPNPVRIPCQWSLVPLPESHLSHVYRLMMRQWDDSGGCVQTSWHLPYAWGKLRETSARRSSDEGCSTSHRLKCGLLTQKYIDGFAQHDMEGDGRKIRRKGWDWAIEIRWTRANRRLFNVSGIHIHK